MRAWLRIYVWGRSFWETSDRIEIEFVILIQSKQQTLFHAITVSANDPEKMNNTHSITMLFTACKQNILKFDLLDDDIPEDNCFDKGHSNYRKIKFKDDGDPVTYDNIFTDYLTIFVLLLTKL